MVKNLPPNSGDSRDAVSIPGSGRYSGGGKQQPTPVFSPGESPWTEEPGRLESNGSQRVGHDWVTEYVCKHLSRQFIKIFIIAKSTGKMPSISSVIKDVQFKLTISY